MIRRDALRSPIKHVRGYGSAHDGTHHFWVQRLTAVALVPLLVWLVVSVVGLTDASYDGFTAWVAAPLNSVLLTIALVAMFCATARVWLSASTSVTSPSSGE